MSSFGNSQQQHSQEQGRFYDNEKSGQHHSESSNSDSDSSYDDATGGPARDGGYVHVDHNIHSRSVNPPYTGSQGYSYSGPTPQAGGPWEPVSDPNGATATSGSSSQGGSHSRPQLFAFGTRSRMRRQDRRERKQNRREDRREDRSDRKQYRRDNRVGLVNTAVGFAQDKYEGHKQKKAAEVAGVSQSSA